MGSKILSVTIPEELYAQVEKQRKVGHYSRSELVRVALRRFLGIPIVQATQEEIEAIKQGQEAIARGEFVTLEELEEEWKAENKNGS